MFELLRAGLKIAKSYRDKDYMTHVEKYNPSMNVTQVLGMIQEAANEDDTAREGRRSVTDPLRQHDWVANAVGFLARNVARCPFKLKTETDEDIKKGDIFQLFEDVNPYMSKYQLWEATESWLRCRGEAIWSIEFAEGGSVPKVIYVADPATFTHILNKQKTEIVRWDFRDPKSYTSKPIPFRPYEILHFRKWNKWDLWRGVSPLIAHMENIEADYQVAKSNTNQIKNGSVPPLVLSSEQTVTDAQADELIKRWEDKHKGASRAHRTALLGRGVKAQVIGLSPKEMEFLDLKKWDRVSILSAYGLSLGVFGIRDDANPLSGTDSQAQLRSVWTLVMKPELKFLEDKMRTDFFQRYSLDMRGEFDLSGIEELQDDQGVRIERAYKLWQMGFTASELNEKFDLGFEKKAPWREYWWKPALVEQVRIEDLNKPKPEPQGQFPQPNPNNTPPPAARSKAWLVPYMIKSEKRFERIKNKYSREIRDWLYDARSWYLDKYTKVAVLDVHKTYDDFVFWAEKYLKLKTFSEKYFYDAIEETGKDLQIVFAQSGFDITFDIGLIEGKMNNLVKTELNKLSNTTDDIRDALSEKISEGFNQGLDREQMADMIRENFKSLENRADVIADTELYNIKSETEASAYDYEGVKYIRWIHHPELAESGIVRDWHQEVDQQVKLFMFQTFHMSETGTDVFHPHAPNMTARDVIHCHCDFIPATEEEYREQNA